MRPAPRHAPAFAAVAVALVAAAWFWPGTWLTLEWVDQGQIMYGAWRVARGELPYRDFDHLYGPALFYLNGVLMRWFGEDLAVARVGLLVVKALLAGLLFLVCRAVARPAIALLVTAWFVVQWGAPLWVYATPYAGHYTLACCLLGIVILLGDPAPSWRRALAAGLAVGIGATFKHTTGLFVALGMLVALASAPAPGGVRDGLAGAARALRIAAALAMVLVVIAYLAPTLDTWTGALLIAPPLLAVVLEWLRDAPAERALAAGQSRVQTTLAFGLGFVLPLLAWAAIYAAQGALGDLVHDLLVGLPQLVDWRVPLDPPRFLTVCLGAALATGAAGLATGRSWALIAGGAGTLGLVLAAAVVPHWGIMIAQLTRVLPIVLVWATAPLALRHARAPGPRLLWWFGALVCVTLHPASDLPHALMILPAVLPLLALLIEAAWSRTRRPLERAAVVALIGAPLLARAEADVTSLVRAVSTRPAGDERTFDRARGVWDPAPPFDAMRTIISRLDGTAPRGTPLLVLPSAQLLYVLADRPSALPRAELVLYSLAIDVMRPEAARQLMSDDDLVTEVAKVRPLIVRAPDAGWERIAAAFPRLRDWIDHHYEVTDTVGKLQVLRPRSD